MPEKGSAQTERISIFFAFRVDQNLEGAGKQGGSNKYFTSV